MWNGWTTTSRASQDFHRYLRTSRQSTVAGQEHSRPDLHGGGVVECVRRLEVVSGAEFGGPLDHRRANFDHDKLDPGEKHIELGQSNEIALQQRL